MRLLHHGIASLSDAILFLALYLCFVVVKESDMLKKLYRGLVVGRAASASYKTVQYMTDAQLADMRVSRSQYPLKVIQQIEADFARKDMKTQANQNFNVSFNPNLSGAV